MLSKLSSRLRAVGFLAVAALVFTTAPVWARPHGGGGGHGGGHGGGFHGGGFHGGGFGYRGYGGYGGYRGFGYGGYGLGYGGYGLGYGGYGYGGYGGYSYPSYYYTYPSYSAYVPSTTTYITPAAGTTYVAPVSSASGDPSPTPSNRASIQLRVPANAEVWIGGEKTAQTGATREFVSPPLTPGQDFVYTVRARWTTASGPHEESRDLHVQANRTASLNLTASASATLPAPAAR